jgi:hypothetical protein
VAPEVRVPPRAAAWGQLVAVEDVVAEHERDGLAGDELFADEEGLGEPSGFGCTAYSRLMPNCEPSPSSRWNAGWSSGVVMTRTSRMPASMSVVSG